MMGNFCLLFNSNELQKDHQTFTVPKKKKKRKNFKESEKQQSQITFYWNLGKWEKE